MLRIIGPRALVSAVAVAFALAAAPARASQPEAADHFAAGLTILALGTSVSVYGQFQRDLWGRVERPWVTAQAVAGLTQAVSGAVLFVADFDHSSDAGSVVGASLVGVGLLTLGLSAWNHRQQNRGSATAVPQVTLTAEGDMTVGLTGRF